VKSLALLTGLLIVILGFVGVVAPGILVTIGLRSVTPAGLYVVAALRIIIGLVLLGASAASRTPRTLRVLGIVALAAGVMTPFLGVERARAIMNWLLAPGPVVMRLWALLAVAFGGFIIYIVVKPGARMRTAR
jgi:hypothetical protein